MYRHHFVKPKKMNNEINPMKIDSPLPVGQGLLIIAASRSHFKHTTVGRTPLDDRSTRRRDLHMTAHKSQLAKIHDPGGIRTLNPNKLAAAYLRLRPRRDWVRL
jgi:hypothetical protein